MAKSDNRHIIWSDVDLDLDDWREELLEMNPDMTEDQLYSAMYEYVAEALVDERANLDIHLPQPILVIADLGLWFGHRPGYKEIPSGNIKDCLYTDRSIDNAEWYVDARGDLRANAYHHDGVNTMLYRVYKDSTTETQRENLKVKIYTGTVTRADITRLTTRLGDTIGEIYGWRFPVHSPKKKGA